MCLGPPAAGQHCSAFGAVIQQKQKFWGCPRALLASRSWAAQRPSGRLGGSWRPTATAKPSGLYGRNIKLLRNPKAAATRGLHAEPAGVLPVLLKVAPSCDAKGTVALAKYFSLQAAGNPNFASSRRRAASQLPNKLQFLAARSPPAGAAQKVRPALACCGADPYGLQAASRARRARRSGRKRPSG